MKKIPKPKHKQFKKYFNTSDKFMDYHISMLTGKYTLNIIAFDNYMQTQGYDIEKHGSLAMFIEKNYGDDAKKFIESVL